MSYSGPLIGLIYGKKSEQFGIKNFIMQGRRAKHKFFVTTPSVPGKYEFIAYVVYHPFRYTSGTKADVPSICYRFTLNVG